MRRIAITSLVALALAACKPASERAGDSLQAIDTLKPAPAADSVGMTTAADSAAIKGASTTTKAGTKTKLGRDSAFPPPRNLPSLDTVRRRPPA